VDGVVRIENAMALGSAAGNTRLMGGALELRGGISILGESLAVDAGPAEIHSTSGNNTWAGAWIIDPIDVPIVVVSGSQLTAAGALSGVGGLHKDGLGTFVLSGANTYAGVTHVAAGTLTIRSNLALGSTTGITEVLTGATLGLRDSILVTGEVLELHADSKLTSGGGSNTWTGAINLRSDPPIDVETGSVLELTGAIDGAEILQKLGGGTLIVSGASPAYTGVLQVFAGTLVLNGALPNASIELAGGTLGGSGAVASVSIHGTAGADAIKINPAASAGRVEAIVNGVSQGIFTPTERIIVLAGAGDDDVQVAGSIAVSAWLYGEAGNDQLKGGAGHDVLLGGANDDYLIGGSGDDLLIGGAGADRIVGNGDDDLQIAGATAFDANAAALAGIMAEWTSARDYETRIANLTGAGSGPRLNAGYFLKTDGPNATVFDDAAKDMLTGSSGLSWFFANLETGVLDKITDLNTAEFAADVDSIGP
jgi:autotransporter-associated beta strand protein